MTVSGSPSLPKGLATPAPAHPRLVGIEELIAFRPANNSAPNAFFQDERLAPY
jgi:hypothetical protein